MRIHPELWLRGRILVNMSNGSRLLILACCQRKRAHPSLLPAIDKYDGPTFRVLRRYQRAELACRTDVYILSAEFGLLSADRLIPSYDRPMTLERARELHPSVLASLNQVFNAKGYHTIFVCMGQAYSQAIAGFDSLTPPTATVHVATGSLGRQLSQLHDWLNGHPPPHHSAPKQTAQAERVHIRGVEIGATRAHALEIARRALEEGVDGVTSYQSWCVSVESRRVAPKWLVSQLSGLPVSAFTTDEARRVLMQLGIGVERV